MRTLILGFGLFAGLAASHLSAAIIAGPITNPATHHEYYLLSADSWTASETEAEHLGGTLAIVKNAGEQEWIFSTFANYGGTNRNLWIGLYRSNPSRSLVWTTGWKGEYANWAGGQPDDAGRVEGCVFMSVTHPWGFADGRWGDCANDAMVGESVPNGIVEVPGKSNEKALSGTEKALKGAWYAAGKLDCPCQITGTDNALFIINESNSAGRIIITPENHLFVAPWRLYGELVKDKILWSNGTWWSREPIRYDNAAGGGSIHVEGLDRAAGKEYDTPELRGGFRSGGQ
jgi:Lectin C-type domain